MLFQSGPIVFTIIPGKNIQLFETQLTKYKGIQNRIGRTVHEVSGMVFFRHEESHHLMMCYTHCPSNLITVAGSLGHSGKKDRKAAQFSDPSDIGRKIEKRRNSLTHQIFQSGITFFSFTTPLITASESSIQTFLSPGKRRREDCLTDGEDFADSHAETNDTK